MIILVDQEGGNAIVGFCDMALKTGGKQNLEFVNKVLANLKPIPTQTRQEEAPPNKFLTLEEPAEGENITIANPMKES